MSTEHSSASTPGERIDNQVYLGQTEDREIHKDIDETETPIGFTIDRNPDSSPRVIVFGKDAIAGEKRRREIEESLGIQPTTED